MIIRININEEDELIATTKMQGTKRNQLNDVNNKWIIGNWIKVVLLG